MPKKICYWASIIGTLMLAVVGLSQGQIPNPDIVVVVEANNVNTLDPHFSSDGASDEIISNIYNPLVRYDGESVAQYKPMLATVVPSVENGLIVRTEQGSVVYKFPIREGVYFHKVGIRQEDGSVAWKEYDSLNEREKGNILPGYGELTPEDVKYSFMREMIQDRSGGLSDALLEALTGHKKVEDIANGIAGVDDFSDVDEGSLIKTFEVLDKTIVVKGNIVEFHLPAPYPPFMSYPIGHPSMGEILDKEWVIAQGGWPGTADTWKAYHDPPKEEDVLYDETNGTGPFKLASWDKSQQIVTLARFDGYWAGPAKIRTVIRKAVPEWSTRRLMLERGDADLLIRIPDEYLSQVEEMRGVRVREVLRLSGNNVFFTWNISGGKDNPAIGSGKLDGNGIPPDLFTDLNVRKAFSYAFDYETYFEQVVGGHGFLTGGPLFKGQLGYRDDQPLYHYDLAKATEYFKKAYDGRLWEAGFEFTAYTSDYVPSWKPALEVLQQNLLRINPKFKMHIQVLQWSTFLSLTNTGQMPLFAIMAGSGSTSDSSRIISHHMSSSGLYGECRGPDFVALAKKEFDPLSEEALTTVDEVKREQIYAQLNKLAHDYALAIFLGQRTRFHAERDWLNGFYANPLLPPDFYTLWKGY